MRRKKHRKQRTKKVAPTKDVASTAVRRTADGEWTPRHVYTIEHASDVVDQLDLDRAERKREAMPALVACLDALPDPLRGAFDDAAYLEMVFEAMEEQSSLERSVQDEGLLDQDGAHRWDDNAYWGWT